jgi:hypothetical protein
VYAVSSVVTLKPPYKAKAIYAFSAITGLGAIVGYVDFGE